MDIGALTQMVISYILPALPFLTVLGTKAAEKAAEEIGSEAWETAQGVWKRLLPTLDAKPAAAEAARDAAADSDNEDAVAALRHQLKKILTDKPELAEELSTLLVNAKPPVVGNVINVSGSRNVTSGGSMSGNTINTGDSFLSKNTKE